MSEDGAPDTGPRGVRVTYTARISPFSGTKWPYPTTPLSTATTR
jgi:hypothetical protein